MCVYVCVYVLRYSFSFCSSLHCMYSASLNQKIYWSQLLPVDTGMYFVKIVCKYIFLSEFNTCSMSKQLNMSEVLVCYLQIVTCSNPVVDLSYRIATGM